MKTINFLFLALTIALTATSCSDDTPDFDYDLPEIEDGAYDVLNGYNSIILNTDSIYDIQVYTPRPVELQYKENEYVDFVVKKAGKRQAIHCVLKNSLKHLQKPLSLCINVKVRNVDQKASTRQQHQKSLYLTLRNPHPLSVQDFEDISYAKAIGKGTQLHKDIGNTTYSILDFNAIAPILAKNKNTLSKTSFYEMCGQTYSAALKAISMKAGVSAAISPTDGVILTGSVSYDISKSTKHTNNFEYYLSMFCKQMSEVKFDVNVSEDLDLYGYLDSTVNDILNNPKSKAYQKYANNEEGIHRLLQNYGTHIITKGSFGGCYNVLYAREANAYDSKIGAEMAFVLGGRATHQSETESWAKAFSDMTGSVNVNGNLKGNGSVDDVEKASRAFYKITAFGGNSSHDITSWDKSINSQSKTTWKLIKYSTSDREDGQLIPLYDERIVKDTVRREAIKKYWDSYFNTIKGQESTSTPIVIADFMMLCGHNNHKKGEPATFIGRDPYNRVRYYYPMMGNINAPCDKEHGYPLETSSKHYINCTDRTDQYWYYALGHYEPENGFYGFTDVAFSNKDKDMQKDGYLKRGQHADHDMGGFLDNNYVWLKPATSKTNIKNVIKAIGLQETDEDKIISSTGGAELPYPCDKKRQTDFNNYWSNALKSSHKKAKEWYVCFYIIKPCNFEPCYSCKNLKTDFLHGDIYTSSPVCHPKPWD